MVEPVFFSAKKLLSNMTYLDDGMLAGALQLSDWLTELEILRVILQRFSKKKICISDCIGQIVTNDYL